MKSPKRGRSLKRHQTRLLAAWQRGLIWVVWLGFFALCISNSDRGELSSREFVALLVAGALTIWCVINPLGIDKVQITDPNALRGEFRSRTNWALVLLGAAMSLVGIAAVFKIGHDLFYGFTTVIGIFEDFGLFFLELFLERISRGTDGDVTKSRLYILMVLLPVGLLLLWFNLLPWMFRGAAFRISDDGQMSFWLGGQWQPLRPAHYRRVTADGISIEFTDPINAQARVTLPQGRVFSMTLGTRVSDVVLADFFRRRLEKAGFKLLSQTGDAGGNTWEFSREEPPADKS